MPIVVKCPFFGCRKGLKVYCEGCVLKTPDKKAQDEHILKYCTDIYEWHKCTVANMLERYYDRKDESYES